MNGGNAFRNHVFFCPYLYSTHPPFIHKDEQLGQTMWLLISFNNYLRILHIAFSARAAHGCLLVIYIL
jgi:hypothetical protein